jgi:hypothetical protein
MCIAAGVVAAGVVAAEVLSRVRCHGPGLSGSVAVGIAVVRVPQWGRTFVRTWAERVDAHDDGAARVRTARAAGSQNPIDIAFVGVPTWAHRCCCDRGCSDRALSRGIVAAGIVAAGIVAAGIVAAGVVAAGVVAAGVVAAGVVAAGVVAAEVLSRVRCHGPGLSRSVAVGIAVVRVPTWARTLVRT